MKYIKLTPYQSIFYYEWLNNPNRSDYNIVIDNTVTGKLNLQRCNDSFEQLLNEHFITRHVIKDTEYGLCWTLVEPIVDLTFFHDEPLSDEQIYALVTEPFDLHRGPLARIHIIKIADECYRMIFIFHHIVVDGISTQEIWDKWRKRYNGVDYQMPALAEQTIMHQNLYQHFEQILTEHKDQMVAFWQTHLKNLSGLDLHFLQNSQSKLPGQNLPSISEYLFSYDQDTTKKVNGLRRQYKLTPYLFGQLVMAILLNKMSGDDAIALAYPIAILEGKDLLYGAHINTMVIDYRFDKSTTLSSLINQTLAFYKALKSSHAKYLPINEIINCGSDSSILNVAFAQTFYRDHEVGLNDVKHQSVNHAFQVDLAGKLLLEQQEHNDQINYRVRFDRNVLDSDLIQNFIAIYQKLFMDILDALTSGRHNTAINDIELIDSKQYLTQLRSKPLVQTSLSDVVAEFEKMAYQFPERVAIIYNERKLSYQQLNQLSNQLARYLINEFKLKPDDLVALCIEKSEWMSVCILAILKAGGAYVPLDTQAPKQRLAYILKDTQAKAILTDSALHQSLSPVITASSTPVVVIDSSEFQVNLTCYQQDNLNLSINFNQLAYVIYTSGTTGTPKGVMIEHNSLVNLAIMQANEFGLASRSDSIKNCLWYASYVFDAHVSELFTAIANGHCLHILPENRRLDFNLLDDYIRDEKIDIATIPPALLTKDQLLPLKVLVVAGESCNVEIMERYAQQGTQVINAYGPSENTVCATLHLYQLGDNSANIGLPLSNISVHILDKYLKPLPIGAIGDLYLSGIGLARGYLNNSEQTAQAFVINPFADESNSQKLMYKTGDLARQMPDGCIEYAGRKDFQVKIRGFRIELTEIENCLSQIPQINRSVVLAHTLNSGLKTLVAYYCAETILNEADILQYLQDYLPEYMLPNTFIHLTEFPLTVNGKVNRAVLPSPNFNQQIAYTAPSNKIEAAICQIYEEVLGIDRVGIDDDFMALGGDSISGILLLSKMRHKLNATLSIKDIFTHKTVRLLAKNIHIETTEQSSIIVAEQGDLSGTFKLLPIQQWFFNCVEKGLFLDHQHWNQSFVLDVPRLDMLVLKQSLKLLVSYHDALRLIFVRDNEGIYLQHYCKQLKDIPFEFVNLTAKENREKHLFEQWQLGFDIYHGPLFHIAYIESDNWTHAKLHFVFHHLIIDSVSWHIIQQDLQKIYDSLATNMDANLRVEDMLGEKRTSYRQWVAHIQDYKNHRDVDGETAYWFKITQMINGYRQQLAPLFIHKQANNTLLTLDKAYTTKLRTKIHAVLSTQTHDILLANLVSLIQQFTGIEKHCITLEGHGRDALSTRIDITHTVGWFTNMYPILLTANADLLTHITAVKDTLAEVSSKSIGFGPLFGYQDDYLSPISFNYLGQFDETAKRNWPFIFTDTGTTMSDKNYMANLLSVDCAIIDNELKINFKGYLDSSAITDLGNTYIALLKETIDRLLCVDRPFLTASDIDYVVSNHQLAQLQKTAEIESIYLANSLQQGFIYHAISQGQTDDAYRVQMFWDYHNTLDIMLLKKAWQLVQDNYACLRLRFNWDEELIQIVDKSSSLHWVYYDIGDKSPSQQQIFLQDLYQQDRNQPYDLTVSGLFRVYLVKYGDDDYHCIFSSHHAILDGWSNPILIKAVHETYLALLMGEGTKLKANNAYQNAQSYLQKNRMDDLSYWQLYLAKQQTKEDLSLLLASHARGIQLGSYKYVTTPAQKTLTIDSDLYLALKEMTRQYGVTTNAILQYCWHKVLSVYTGSHDTIVGMVVAGRNLPIDGIDQAVGLFINTLPSIVEHQESASLLTIIQTLQHDIHEANSRSNIHLATLQKSGERLFSSLFVFENYPIPESYFGDKLILNFMGSEEKQDYPLVITVLEKHPQLTLTLNYASELFDSNLIDNLLATIKQVLIQIVNDPQVSHNKINYLNEQQYQRIIYDWNNNVCDYCADKTVINVFEQKVEQFANHPAIIFNDLTLTYQQLNQRVNQLAHYLKQTYQLQPNDLVGLYLDRSENIVISILAVLKAGGAYVPMDPFAPDERNQFIIQDAKMKFVISEDTDFAKISQFTADILLIDHAEVVEALSLQPIINPININKSDDLAYCIYTSGTTGKPKGGLITHQNINRLIINQYYTEITQNDRLLAISGYQFDASIYDIFGSLLNGASLVMTKKQSLLDLNYFNQLLIEQGITHFFTPTVFFNTLVDAQLPQLAYMNYIFVGGESLSVNHVNSFRKCYPNVKLINVYGPTETTTYATAFLTNTASSAFNYTVPIGRPINNTSLYVLNHELNPVPAGAIGELYIGGAGVGKGYLYNLELTAKAFIANPFQTKAEAERGYNDIIYKTGDLVRYLADGNLEYLGRNDSQVKIRGFRIELGEIEVSLTKHPAIKQALVVAMDNAQGDKQLLAYYVAEQALSREELFDYLALTLPEYMIPVAFIYLKAFPLTINDKIDRKALPVIAVDSAANYVSPTGVIEPQVTKIYSELLSLDINHISMTDDFFRLGGNSILAIKLASRLTSSLGKLINVVDIFNYKTIRSLSQYISTLTDLQLDVTAINVKHVEEQRLSYAQERLWFIDRYTGGSDAYNIPLTLILKPQVSLTILVKALNKIIARHEILRTVIKMNDHGDGYQEILTTAVIDLGINTKRCQDISELNDALYQHAHKIFELSLEIPISVQVYYLEQQTYLSIVIHHIAFDGWSIDLFSKELLHYYHFYSHPNEIADLPCVAVQYKDFALWQRHHLQGELLQSQIDYWQTRLQNYQPLNLITDYKRPLNIDYRGADIYFSLTKETSEKLRQLAANLNVSLYTVLLSGYFLLLKAYSHQSDIIVGTPIAGRHYPDIDNTLGFFVNTLALRYQINDQESLAEFIQSIATLMTEAQTYQDLPFEKLVDSLQIEQDPSRHPLFQVMFGMQSFGQLNESDAQSLFTPYQSEDMLYHVAKFDLSTLLNDSKEVIDGVFNYATALFKASSIERYITTYCHILDQLSDLVWQNKPINRLNYLDKQQFQTIIYDWNKTECEYYADDTAVSLFEQQVRRSPHHPAVIFNDVVLTYQQLNQQANQLAHYLQTHYQLKSNDFVGLYLERSEKIVVTILAVLKTGAAYVPMDTSSPDERNQFIMADAGVKLVITEQTHKIKMSELTTNVIALDQADIIKTLMGQSTENPNNSTRSIDLAYCIYTSGTTGKPKGTLITHRNINRLAVNPSYTTITPDDCVLAISGYQFDASTYDIFVTLINGASLVIAEKSVFLELAKLNQLLDEKKITNCFITTAFFNTLVDEKLPNLANLNYVLVGGEALSVYHVERFRQCYPKVKLVNAYGPTETTTYALCFLINTAETEFNNSVPIGKPINNTTVYILDAEQRPLPIGAVGELYIGGAGVGQGYLNKTQLTDNVFINNPFQSKEQQIRGYNDRIYKTGDLVRYLDDGNIEYIGRNDLQVKIRGYRIELAEIEVRLINYAEINQALVIACDNAQGSKQLIAYYVAAQPINREQLFDYLKQYLPEYMIPAAFIHLEALPLTPNGKVNIAALPTVRVNNDAAYIAPQTVTEKKIASLYAELLDVNPDTIGLTDDFFKMGGNSILAIKLAGRLSNSTEKVIHVADIFNYKTVRELSLYIDKLAASQYHITPQIVESAEQQRLSFAQERLWFIDSYVGGSYSYNIPLVLTLSPQVSLTTLIYALNKIIERHEILRTVIKTNSLGEGYQQVLAMDMVNINIGNKICQNVDELNNAIIEHVHKVFNLSTEIPLSIQSYQFNEQTYLSFVVHHIAFDGWSIELLLKELNHYYQFFSSSVILPELPDLSVQYKDFALWQRQYLQDDKLQIQLDYWLDKLSDYQPLNLPTDYPRPKEINYHGADVNFNLTKETSQKLRQLAINLNVSLYTVLLSGYYLLLKAYSNQSDIILGTPIAGRHYLGIENTIGFFVNTLALRREIDEQTGLVEFIQTTGQLLSEAQRYQDLPFEKLVDALAVSKDLSRHPIFQVMFSVQSFGSLSQPSNRALFTPYQVDALQYQIAKFDLTTILDDSQEIITGCFNYATALFKHETIKGYVDVYCHILEQFSQLSQKQLLISQLNYLNEVSYEQVIYQWNQTQRDFPGDKTLAQIFEEQVIKTPDNIAVIYEGNRLTYQQLNEKSNQLAYYLKNQFAIQSDDIIAICLDKTEQIVVSILAILKSGGAYVPLSPKLPDERKNWIIDDTQCKVIITSSAYVADLNAKLDGKAAIALPIDTLNLQNDNVDNIITETTSRHLAYIIYTSGTTGMPKGVMIEQHSVINSTFTQRQAMGLEICDASHLAKHTLWYSEYTFDAHVLDIFTPLLTGNCVHIFAQNKRLDLKALIDYATTYQIDYAFIPPVLLDNNQIIPITRILVGGEGISQHIIDYYAAHQQQLVNGYGPTEAAVWATYRIYRQDDANNNIGKPIYNATIYILDNQLRPVPIGAFGELYIGGRGVGRGYLNNLELSNNVFINNPFQTEQQKRMGENSRLYKTGDIVRYLADGNIEYMGRNDFQVKIRGFRIELAEIETQLIKYPTIKQALVIISDNHQGDKQLVAYYVAEQPVGRDELFDFLNNLLPEYMIPAAFIHLNSLPLTLNGKINRSALPSANLMTEGHYVEPLTATEHQVTRLYSELLGLDLSKVSVIDDFFRMGGNSILAIKLANRLSEQTGKAVHIADIFNYKTIQSLSQYIDTVTNYQTVITLPEIHRVQDQRLSFAQERLWFIDRYEGGSRAYNIPLVLILQQQVSLAILTKALNKIVARHEILRTLITADADGIGYQYALTPDNAQIVISHINCDNEQMLNQCIIEHINQVFNLATDIPLSVQSYQLNENRYLSLVIHHIAFDGWSVDLLVKELTYYYHLFNSQSAQPELPAVKVQYKQFALWQRQYLLGQRLQIQLDYWHEKLLDYQTLNIPTDYSRPIQIDYHGADIGFSLTLNTSQKLRQLAANLNVSLYTVLLSGFYLLLRSYSNQSDILIGTPIAGRHYAGIENTMGFFVNTLALRREVDVEQGLADFILTTSDLLTEVQKYQDLPFEKLVEALHIEQDPSRHPLFQVMFGLQSFGSADKGSQDLLFRPYQASSLYNIAKFDLSTMLDDSQEIITGNFNYATALFKAETINRYISVYCYILEQISDLGLQNKPISQLRYLDDSNYNKLINQWNQTRQHYPKDVTIHQMFEAQVAKTPDNIAAIYQNERLTYRELNEKANQLAGYLRDNFTIEADDLVALYLDRSLNMMIAILAVLKSGAAYVPIDPLAPNDRAFYILENTKAKVILTVNHCYEKCQKIVEKEQTIVNLQATTIVEALSHYSSDNLAPLATARNLAYVIYTSGTTGNPKGVMLEHKGVINRIFWMQNQYPITQQDRILQKTNYTFDVSVWELFWANWYGACTVFTHSEHYKDHVYLTELIASEDVTVLHFVPSMLVAFVEALIAYPELQIKLQKLKYLFCSGEALNLYEVKQCHRLIPDCQIHNLYGPTEATVDVLYYDCNQHNLTQVFIGKPIANTTAYILNEQRQPVPIGGLGELYIGGDGVGRGYLYNPTLSNQCFIANPFQTEQEKQQDYNSRLYKTGDVVRYCYDGNIEYLGRNDFQVKIRGYRIELKEIEACLTNHPAINYAVVIAYERSDKDKYLVAYYVASHELNADIMIKHLRQKLPEYMLPVAFVHLNSLPVTSNGKLDRKQLPKPEIDHATDFISPSSKLEKALIDIFADTLSLSSSEISLSHNFFKLGGNSILAMKLNSRINQLFQIRLSLVDILSTNTIAELAIKIASMDKLEFNPVVSMSTINNKPQIFLIHPGMGGCSVYLSLANRLANHYCCYGIDSYNFYHDNKIDKLDQLAKYYLSYMDKILDSTKPITLLGWSLGGQIALEIAAILEARNVSHITVCALDTWLLNQEDLNEDIPRVDLDELINRLNVPKYLRENVLSVTDVDAKLSLQAISAKLTRTKVILFKATEETGFGALYQKYQYNNIERYLCSSEQLTMVNLETDHYNILEKEQEIIDNLILN